MTERPEPSPALAALIDARYGALAEAAREAGVSFYDDAGVGERLRAVLLASEFAFETLRREPALLGPSLIPFVSDPRHAAARVAALSPRPGDDAGFGDALRRFRRRESLRLVWRDVTGVDPVEATLLGATELAEVGLDAALAQLEPALAERFGRPRGADGSPQRPVVIGMGKLGGGELNFSSDIDLILAFPEPGHCEGARGLANEDWFARLAQRLAPLLGDVTAEGFAFRVDFRLRPFGSVGRMALPFAAMEQYYQREGRDWERYAWIKARPVAGDRHAGARLVALLRPFVYRRYLDYGAIDGLREMKAMIDAEVARRELEDDIKLGPGGIREVEFTVQLSQLVRGGREALLRTPGLLPALEAVERLGLLRTTVARRLRQAYLALRRIENRLQMLRDAQVHTLPDDPIDRERLALAFGHRDWSALRAALDAERTVVAEVYAETLSPRRRRAPSADGDWPRAWRQLVAEGAAPSTLPPFAESTVAILAQLARSAAVRGLEARARERLDRLLPAFLATCAQAPDPDAALGRCLRLVQAVAGRPSYLALLDEQPQARERVLSVFARSAFLGERVIAHPLLLDELLDARLAQEPADATSVREAFRRGRAGAVGDAELELEALHEARQGASFRLGLDRLAGRLDAGEIATRLAGVAEAVVETVLELAARDTRAQHGALPPEQDGLGFVALGYGSLGGAELGFGSDLDLVFVFDGARAASTSAGPRAVEGARWYARLAQRIVHWLTTPTRAGRLYDVDVRLRPDGAKGLLVTTLEGFAEYQRERAWTWEHQALVRARPVAGDPALAARLAAVRREVLMRPRDPDALRADVLSMRRRWRAELDRSGAATFDLKQGPGGLVDLEFLLQALVLEHAARVPALTATTRSADLVRALAASAVIRGAEAEALAGAHAALLARALDCTLDARPRVVTPDPALIAHAERVRAIAAGYGLDYGAAPAAAGVGSASMPWNQEE